MITIFYPFALAKSNEFPNCFPFADSVMTLLKHPTLSVSEIVRSVKFAALPYPCPHKIYKKLGSEVIVKVSFLGLIGAEMCNHSVDFCRSLDLIFWGKMILPWYLYTCCKTVYFVDLSTEPEAEIIGRPTPESDHSEINRINPSLMSLRWVSMGKMFFKRPRFLINRWYYRLQLSTSIKYVNDHLHSLSDGYGQGPH